MRRAPHQASTGPRESFLHSIRVPPMVEKPDEQIGAPVADVLSLFEPEHGGSETVSETPPPAGVERHSSSDVPSAPQDNAPPINGAGRSSTGNGAIPLTRLLDAAGPLRFVDGVAVVQALGTAIKTRDGINAGMPDPHAVFLTGAGEFVLLGRPGPEPAARELARLLHQLVPSESTPPVGRLFVDRWSTGTSTDLTEFASELSYFARPNGRDLLKAVHARCSGDTPAPTTAAADTSQPIAAVAAAPPLAAEPTPESPQAEDQPQPSWLRSHRRQILAAAAVVVAAAVGTGLLTWFWPSPAAQAAQPSTPAAETAALDEPAAPESSIAGPTDAAAGPTAPAGARRGDIPLSPAARATRTALATRSARSAPGVRSSGPVQGLPTMAGAPDAEPATTLASRRLPDMRIYSASDSGIEPPKLRSTEIVEGLITGFDPRTNQVEVIVSQHGDVERVRMLGPPQRIPDVMLLSRVKQWTFDPALKDGTAVRYRLVLSWNVTP